MQPKETINKTQYIQVIRNTFASGELITEGKVLKIPDEISPEDAAALLNFGKARPATEPEKKR